MNAQFHGRFKKRYKKLRISEHTRVKERLRLFKRDPFDPLLNNHPLQGKYQGCRSINISGDLRAIYRELNTNSAYFVEPGTHTQLYS